MSLLMVRLLPLKRASKLFDERQCAKEVLPIALSGEAAYSISTSALPHVAQNIKPIFLPVYNNLNTRK